MIINFIDYWTAVNMSLASARWNIDPPLWDQSTYMGRFKHFGWVTDPRLVFYSTSNLMSARELVLAYKYVHYF